MSKFVVAFMSILIGVTGQFFFKKGAYVLSEISIKSILSIFTNIYLLIGLSCYGISTILWLNVLSKLKMSVAYPLLSLGYILALLIAYFALGESIKSSQVAGTFLIIAGVFLIAR